MDFGTFTTTNHKYKNSYSPENSSHNEETEEQTQQHLIREIKFLRGELSDREKIINTLKKDLQNTKLDYERQIKLLESMISKDININHNLDNESPQPQNNSSNESLNIRNLKKDLTNYLRENERQELENKRLQENINVLKQSISLNLNKLNNNSSITFEDLQLKCVQLNELLTKKDIELMNLRWTVEDLTKERLDEKQEFDKISNNTDEYTLDLSEFIDDNNNNKIIDEKEDIKEPLELEEQNNSNGLNSVNYTELGISDYSSDILNFNENENDEILLPKYIDEQINAALKVVQSVKENNNSSNNSNSENLTPRTPSVPELGRQNTDSNGIPLNNKKKFRLKIKSLENEVKFLKESYKDFNDKLLVNFNELELKYKKKIDETYNKIELLKVELDVHKKTINENMKYKNDLKNKLNNLSNELKNTSNNLSDVKNKLEISKNKNIEISNIYNNEKNNWENNKKLLLDEIEEFKNKQKNIINTKINNVNNSVIHLNNLKQYIKTLHKEINILKAKNNKYIKLIETHNKKNSQTLNDSNIWSYFGYS